MPVSERLIDGTSFLRYAAVRTSRSLSSPGGSPVFEPEEVRTVLAFTISGIGNTILYTPTLINLRRALPNARIVVIVGPRGAADAEEGSPYADEVITLPVFSRVGGMADSMAFARRLRRMGPQLTLNNFLSTGPDNAMLAFRSGARWRAGHAYGPEDRHWKPYYLDYEGLYTHTAPVVEDRHEVDLNLDLLRALDLPVRRVRPFFHTEKADKASAGAFLKDRGLVGGTLIGFHPGTHPDMTFKRWHPERFAAVIRRVVKDLGATPVIFGSGDEKGLAKKILRKAGVGDDGANLCGELSLRRSAAVISRCKAFVSNDSGLMHVAAAMGVPVVGIFGPTDHRRTSPYGKEHIVVRTGEGCSPCYVRSGTRVKCPHYKCMTGVTVGMVWNGLTTQLEKGQSERYNEL